MMTTQTMPVAANSDTQLVEWSLTGDRDAFRQIVERYQSLVCSITYNATGSLTLSEDLTQDWLGPGSDKTHAPRLAPQ